MSPIKNTITSGRFGGVGTSSGAPNGTLELEQTKDVLVAEDGVTYITIE